MRRGSVWNGSGGAKIVAVAGPFGVVGNVAADAAGDGEELVGAGTLEVCEVLVGLADVEQARAGPFLARGGGSVR